MSNNLTGWRQSIQVLSGTLGADWERDRRDTLFLMGAIAVSFLGHLPHLPIWVTISFGVLFLWRLGLIMSGRWLPGQTIRIAAAFAATIGVYAYYKTLFGREPGTALLVLFLGLKLMEMQAKRDLFVVVFLCLFLLMLSFLFSQSIGTLLVVSAGLVCLLTALISMQFGYHEAPIKHRFKLAGGLLARALPVAMVLFFLFPRIENPLWKMPGNTSRGSSGLSDTMAPGSITDLAQSDELVFRVLFKGAAPNSNQLYWRGPTFGHYDGRSWSAVKYELAQPPAPEFTRDANTKPVEYEVTLEPTQQNQLFVLEYPIAMPVIPDRSVQTQPDMLMLVSKPLSDRIRYSATSILGGKLGLNETPLSRQNWMSLPPGYNPKTLQMALDWRNSEPDEKKLIQKALTLFKEQPFYYTLKPPAYGKDGVDEFLFNKKRGFCEHYSQAFVVLMRALDIPARVVTGYSGGEFNPVDGFFSIRQKEAHAWAEVWLVDQGWVRIDPTTAIDPSRIEKESRPNNQDITDLTRGDSISLANMLRFRYEAISNAWKQWMLNYDKAKQRSLFGMIGLDPDDWQHLAGLLAVGMGVSLGFVALVTLRQRVKPDPVEQSFLRACQKLTQFGLQKNKGETPLQFAARVNQSAPTVGSQFHEIVTLYSQIRYAQDAPIPRQIVQLRQLVKALPG
jgi:protein-glutamine gamma-glutamyltransferase